MRITAVEKVSKNIRNIQFDGILGMGLGLEQYPDLLWFKQAYDAGHLRQNRFGIWINRRLEPNEVHGQLCLGCIDESRISGTR